eukprot:526433-Pelagomonas_calceolata.AAC.1
METASWADGISPVCDKCSCGQIQDDAHVLFMCCIKFPLAKRIAVQCNKKHLYFLWRNTLFYFMSELLDLLLAGLDQPQADQLNSLAEGLPV